MPAPWHSPTAARDGWTRSNRAEARRPLVIADARIVDPAAGLDAVGAIHVVDGRITAIGPQAASLPAPDGAEIVDGSGLVAAPGLVDMLVYVGEPGHEHRETLATASQAAAAGGVTTIVTMPDTDPVIDDPALVDFVLRRARDTAIVNVHPMAALTKGLEGRETTEIGLLGEAGAVAFTNGRRPIVSSRVMRRALTYGRDFGALIVNRPEDPELVGSGVMNEGETASRLGLSGIPREAEVIALERDLRLVALTGGRYHAALVSCAASVEAIRAAKAAGLDVTAATSTAHLALNERDIGAYRTFVKLSPPLRSEEDRLAVVAAVADGTIDIVVSNHDPQDVETKRHPFAEAADGAIGLETLLAGGLRLVHNGLVPLPRLIEVLSTAPARRLGLDAGTLMQGSPADIVLFDPGAPWILEETSIVSRSKNTPFEGARFQGKVVATFVGGEPTFVSPALRTTHHL
ncbi:dihydroorotase [Pseudoxanthobacter soli DSM 19599]|uniref:Dihydroorotase n=1 Tax=Pseudoxanthobacter soli DSM 19599 TaxID=1123029 RepID=A0A1M7Z7T7_9HYPH|nr:dihydroorotase [Pseudoxanthobacter soli DSM 19599]